MYVTSLRRGGGGGLLYFEQFKNSLAAKKTDFVRLNFSFKNVISL